VGRDRNRSQRIPVSRTAAKPARARTSVEVLRPPTCFRSPILRSTLLGIVLNVVALHALMVSSSAATFLVKQVLAVEKRRSATRVISVRRPRRRWSFPGLFPTSGFAGNCRSHCFRHGGSRHTCMRTRAPRSHHCRRIVPDRSFYFGSTLGFSTICPSCSRPSCLPPRHRHLRAWRGERLPSSRRQRNALSRLQRRQRLVLHRPRACSCSNPCFRRPVRFTRRRDDRWVSNFRRSPMNLSNSRHSVLWNVRLTPFHSTRTPAPWKSAARSELFRSANMKHVPPSRIGSPMMAFDHRPVPTRWTRLGGPRPRRRDSNGRRVLHLARLQRHMVSCHQVMFDSYDRQTRSGDPLNPGRVDVRCNELRLTTRFVKWLSGHGAVSLRTAARLYREPQTGPSSGPSKYSAIPCSSSVHCERRAFDVELRMIGLSRKRMSSYDQASFGCYSVKIDSQLAGISVGVLTRLSATLVGQSAPPACESRAVSRNLR